MDDIEIIKFGKIKLKNYGNFKPNNPRGKS
jgi:hypothetical protein